MARGRPRGARERWPNALIEAELGAIRAELDAFPVDAREGRRARLQAALRGVVATESDGTERGQLRRYLYAMSCLVHHTRFGGLSAAQARRLAQLALAVLQVQRIPPDSARLAHLYGDVHLVKSQIMRRRGDHWAASWEQQLARRLSRRNAARGAGFQAISFAIRALRLGQVDTAAALYERAEAAATDDATRVRARLGRIRSLRLSGRVEASRELAEASAAAFEAHPAERLELEWEGFCRQAQATGDLGPMLRFARLEGPQRGAVFLLEAWLWASAAPSRRWLAELPSANALGRSKTARARRHGQLFRCVAALEDCYDKRIPYHRKLQQLGEALARLEVIVSVEGELLVLAGAVRWLRRMHADELATLTFGRYQALCWAMSSGRDGDLCGLGGAEVGEVGEEKAAS